MEALFLRGGEPSSHPVLKQLRNRDYLTADEERELLNSISTERKFFPGDVIVRVKSRPDTAHILVEGFAGRYSIGENGQRQVHLVHVPGDFLDLHGFLMKTIMQGSVALSPGVVAEITHDALLHITKTSPHLARVLFLDMLVGHLPAMEWMTRLPHRSAEVRLAHCLCEMHLRLNIVGKTAGDSFEFPVTQRVLSSVLGLSDTHLNRTLKTWRRASIIRWEDGVVTLRDMDSLMRIAEFDPHYLWYRKEPV